MHNVQKKILISLALSTLAIGAFAEEPDRCTSEPKSKWLRDKDVQEQLEKQGYAVRRVKTHGNCYEAYVKDKDGKKAELFINPVNGAMVQEER